MYGGFNLSEEEHQNEDTHTFNWQKSQNFRLVQPNLCSMTKRDRKRDERAYKGEELREYGQKRKTIA